MLLFDFLRKFFSWAGDPSRKRRAVSFTPDSDSDTSVPPKRHKPSSIHAPTDLIQISDSSEDEIQILPPSKPPRTKMGCANPNKSKTSALTKTHRLREKTQYEELLQKFLPHRIHVIKDKPNEKREETVEVIDLGDCENPKFQSCSRFKKSSRHLVIDLEEEASKADFSKKELSFNSKKQWNEQVKVNSLRDQLSAKDVIRQDYVPRIAKRYNERVEQRHREAEELKKMTTVLSKHNRLAREAALEEHLARSMRLYEAVLDETEEEEEQGLPVLTEGMLRMVRGALVPQPADQVLVEGFGLRIARKDMYTLSNSNWLNDEVINFYMNLLISRGGRNNYPRVHAMNTFFYPKLITGGHSSLRRWTRKVDIFAQDLIVVPIHLGIHWCMAIIDFRERTIKYYDSMGGDNHKCLGSLKSYLEAESLDKKGRAFDTKDWRLINAKDIPQQMNGSDCGVFSCMFAEFVCAGRRITFSQDDMGYFRKKMVYEILTSKIL